MWVNDPGSREQKVKRRHGPAVTSSSGGRRQDCSPVGEKANPKRGHGERGGDTDEPSVKWTDEEGGWGDKPGGSNHREWATRASRGLSA